MLKWQKNIEDNKKKFKEICSNNISRNIKRLKKIGTYAREDLEKELQDKVNLQLWVKVREDWINNDKFVKLFKNTD